MPVKTSDLITFGDSDDLAPRINGIAKVGSNVRFPKIIPILPIVNPTFSRTIELSDKLRFGPSSSANFFFDLHALHITAFVGFKKLCHVVDEPVFHHQCFHYHLKLNNQIRTLINTKF